jgi:hypothetical protein
VITIGDPLVSAAIGLLAFHERIASGPGTVALELGGAVVMVAGVCLLARSPLAPGAEPAPATAV